MTINWQRRIVWSIRLGELVAFVGMYLFLYLIYCFTLTINESAYVNFTFGQLLKNYLVSQAIDYGLKFLYTIPLWYLYFRVIKHWSLFRKIFLHQFTSFLFVLCWIKSYYWVLEFLGRGHLRGTSQIWDVYIPALIYIIQFGFFHAYEYHLEVQRQREIEAQLRQANLKSELTAIKAQLNPHFLYNVFNTISASVPPEMEHTREMIALLADMFRYQLRASKEDTVLLSDEINFIEQYLSLERDRFGNRLRTSVVVEPGLEHMKIPPMILQPIVENAVKHGVSPKIEASEVNVRVSKQGLMLRFEVADTGVGVSQPELSELLGQGVGLSNTQLRLEKMFGTSLHLEPNVPQGLKVWFDVPC